MGQLDGRIAVISGGSRGQGAAEARLFCSEGATVIVCDLLEKEGAELVADINSAGGGKAVFRKLDVSKKAEWDSLGKFIADEFGKAHILINNAGITFRAGTLGTEIEDWENVISINLTGAFLGIKTLTPLMQAAGGGVIINIGSVAGRSGYHSVSYGTSKWGLTGLTRSAAIELVDWNIRVNMVSPGVVETPLATMAAGNFGVTMGMTPMNRPGKPEEIADLVMFLVSDKAAFITGEDIAIDGGLSAGGMFRYIARETGVFTKK